MYALYGTGLMIYNGLDIDSLNSGTVPGTTGVSAFARLWLLELLQPWGADYNLPCGTSLVGNKVPVGGTVINPESSLLQPAAMMPYVAIALIAACFVVFATLYRKNGSRTIQ
jgi:hypothetical protein